MGAAVASVVRPCIHCGRHNAEPQKRGLCRNCRKVEAIRQRYLPPGAASFRRRHTLPPRPTQALPGSAEKKAVMALRASLGQSIFHPLDATLRPTLEERANVRHPTPGGLRVHLGDAEDVKQDEGSF